MGQYISFLFLSFLGIVGTVKKKKHSYSAGWVDYRGDLLIFKEEFSWLTKDLKVRI